LRQSNQRIANYMQINERQFWEQAIIQIQNQIKHKILDQIDNQIQYQINKQIKYQIRNPLLLDDI